MASRLASILVLGIVAATLIAGLIAGAQNDSNGPVDLIVLNGRVVTGVKGAPIEDAVAVRGNQILKVGSNREIRRLTRAQTTVIDAHGGTVVPGFVDPNVDLFAEGLASERLNLKGLDSIDEIEHAIVRYAESYPDRPWIEAIGWNPSLNEKTPTRQALDALVPDRPVSIVSEDESMMWANSLALDAAGISGPGRARDASIVRDKRGEPTGILRGPAQKLVVDAVPAPSAAAREQALEDAIAIAHQAGVTSVHNAPTSEDDLRIMARLRRSGEMGVRVYQVLQSAIDGSKEAGAGLESVRREYPEVPLFKTGAVRIELPPADERIDRDALGTALTSRVAQLDKDGWQVIVAANDASAIELATKAFERVSRSSGFKARRHRIEATDDSVDAELTARLAKIGVSVTTADARPLDPLGSIADEVEESNAKSYAGLLREAIDRYTSGAAYASLDEQRKGTLAPGMLADLVILSDDVFAVAPVDLRNVKVNVTVFDGKVVYDRAAAHPTTY
jgi:predicted amidohydrolase YtcJ